MNLYRDAPKAGFDIKVLSAYRDYDLQASLFDYWCRTDGIKQALRTSAKAGRSEHQTGYALDVSCEELNWDLLERFGDTAEGKWLGKNAHKYGFIVRYGKDTEAITGYAYEPWHIRYVGEKAAKEAAEASKGEPFTSMENFRDRTKTPKSVVDKMKELGLMGDLEESDQLSFNFL